MGQRIGCMYAQDPESSETSIDVWSAEKLLDITRKGRGDKQLYFALVLKAIENKCKAVLVPLKKSATVSR